MTTTEQINPCDPFVESSDVRMIISRNGTEQCRRSWDIANPIARVLLLHGIAEHSGRYEHVGVTLNNAGFSVLSYDHQGHGRSGGVRGYVPSFETFLDDVEDHLGELRDSGDPVVLMAHSMGGLIASAYCVSGRPLPDILLLSGPALGADVPRWQEVSAPLIGKVLPKLFIKNEFDGSLLSTNPAVGSRYEADPLRVKGSTAGLGRALFAAMEDTNATLDRLTIPTMVIHGGADRIVPAHYSEPIGDLPVATRIVLAGLEHEILNEHSWESTLEQYIAFAKAQLEL